MATFTTADMNALADDFSATIDWGDGTTDTGAISGGNGSFTVTADHIYAEKGSYPVSILIDNSLTGGTANAASTATVADGALNLTGGWQLGDPMTDAQNTFTLASFTDGNPNAQTSDYTVTINWGDGTQSTNDYVENAGDGQFLIVAPHSYPNPLPMNAGPVTYTVTVQLTDVDGVSASTTSTVVVGNIVPGVAATMNNWAFVDENPNATVSDFVAGGQAGMAAINWGDGDSSLGTIGGSGGSFWVTGQHTYAQDSYDQPNGQYQITVTVTDVDGSTLTGTQYVSVVRPPVTLYTGNVGTPANSLTLSNVQVAAFTVPDAVDGTGEFSATIQWGDGSSGSGTIQEVSPGLFGVMGNHAYASAGTYQVIVDVSQGWQSQKRIAVNVLYAAVGTLPIVGPTAVPGNSIYTYFAPLLGPVVGVTNPWKITTDPGVAGNAAPQVLLWGTTRAPINGKLMPALFADIQFSNSNPLVATISAREVVDDKFVQTFITHVDVVQVRAPFNVFNANRNTVLDPIAQTIGQGNISLQVAKVPTPTWILKLKPGQYGDNLGAFTFTGNTLGAEPYINFDSGNPTFKTRVLVKLVTPAGAPASITKIQVGLIQNVQSSGFALYPFNLFRRQYIGGVPSWEIPMLDWTDSKGAMANHNYSSPYAPGILDEGSQWPWYKRSARSPNDANNSNSVLSMTDAPDAGFPHYYNGIQRLPLIGGIITENFNLYVAARTTQSEPTFLPWAMSGFSPQGRSDNLFYSEAYMNWHLLDAVTGGAVFNFGYVTGGKSLWRSQQMPFLPEVNVVPGNVGVNPPFSTWD